MNPNADEFSVCRFFPDGTYEYVCRFVSAEQAVVTAKVCTAMADKTGTTRLIVTDGGDCIVFEWQQGRGVTYPPLPVKGEE